MKDGWLCDSILKTTHKPSPMSTAPAFSPGPCTTRGPVVGSFLRWTRELLYEQCSDHITENMPNSVIFGSRPSISTIFLYSSSVRLCCAMRSFVITGAVTITTASRYTSHCQRLFCRITICVLGLSTWTIVCFVLPVAYRFGNGPRCTDQIACSSRCSLRRDEHLDSAGK